MAAANAQTNQSDAALWLEKSPIAPAFHAPASKAAWEKGREQIRAQVWDLLGKLPARPKTPKVQTLSREDRGDYIVEKFQFDNGAGAIVPGYIILPKSRSGKAPAILPGGRCEPGGVTEAHYGGRWADNQPNPDELLTALPFP